MSRNPLDSRTNDERVNDFGERTDTEKLKDKVEDIASRAKDKAGQWTDAASDTVDRQRENASSGLERAASTLHEKAENIPGGPRAAHAVYPQNGRQRWCCWRVGPPRKHRSPPGGLLEQFNDAIRDLPEAQPAVALCKRELLVLDLALKLADY